MRLIDADALHYRLSVTDDDEQIFYLRGEDIANAPTIDAVPVVRCKECAYRQKASINDRGFLICPASGMEITDDDYCSYGKREEANHETSD